jgi:ribosomal-protein-alanine N-acetyltransferase
VRGRHIYEECPVYTSEHFLLRLIEESDAKDLLQCYSDPSAVRLMNADNCGGTDFHFRTLPEIDDFIQGQLLGYRRCITVRFTVVDTQESRAIGTVEMYDKSKELGILRLDLRSAYERQDHIVELLTLSIESFYEAFGVQQIATKAIPAATERIAALRACGFAPAEGNVNGPHGDYYVR